MLDSKDKMDMDEWRDQGNIVVNAVSTYWCISLAKTAALNKTLKHDSSSSVLYFFDQLLILKQNTVDHFQRYSQIS